METDKRHRARYTDTDWGLDYDYVLDDDTTRVRRVFIEQASDIEAAMAAWSVVLTDLRDTGQFNSSLLPSPLDGYLDRPDERPHLWKEITFIHSR